MYLRVKSRLFEFIDAISGSHDVSPFMPGAKKAKKPKTQIQTPVVVSAVVLPEIEHAEDWNVIVNILCDYFKLPGLSIFHIYRHTYHFPRLPTDLSTRSGLKKVHSNFAPIYSKLEKTYDQSGENYKIKGAIVGIVAKMCIDSLLRNKLFGKGAVSPFSSFISFSNSL